MNKNLVISTKTIFVTLGLVVLAILLYQIRDVILMLLVALILALSIEPVVRYMVKNKFPRWMAVTLVFAATVFLVILFFTIALPIVIEQTRKLVISIPDFVNSIVKTPELRTSLNNSISQFTIASGGLFTFTYSFFANILSIMTVFIFTLYLSIDLPNVKKRFIGLFTDDLRDYVDETWNSVEVNLSHWIKGQLFLMLVVGLAGYIGLILIGVPYAAPLAIISGLLEVVPVLGPIIATLIAGLVGFAINPVVGLIVTAMFIGIQQLENNFLVPKVMQKVTGFNPLVTMIALLIGGKLFGIVGAIISIPVALIVVVTFHRLINLDLES